MAVDRKQQPAILAPFFGAKIAATSIEVAHEFYCRGLGLTLRFPLSPETHFGSRGAADRYLLLGHLDWYLVVLESSDRVDLAGPRDSGIVLTTSRLFAFRERLRSLGAPVSQVHRATYGGSEFQFTDPFGNTLTMWTAGG